MAIPKPGVQSESTLRHIHGRGLNTTSTKYALPADTQELGRLSIQHRIWSLMMGGLYPSDLEDDVQRLLSPENGKQPMILDIGSGSGAWAVDMAKQFPHAKVVGVDLLGVPSTSLAAPPNCSFIKGDITQGFEEFVNQFDIVQTRTVIRYVDDPVALHGRIASFLQPGGLFLSLDVVNTTLDEHMQFVPAAREDTIEAGRSWLARWAQEIFERGVTNNKNRYLWEHRDLLREDSNFRDLKWRDYLSPLNWPGEGIEHGETIGEFHLTNTSEFLKSTKVGLLDSGVEKDEVEKWYRNAQAEIHGPLIKIYHQWRAIWVFAVKNDTTEGNGR